MKHFGIEDMELDDTTTQEEYKEASSQTRARNLAMELSKERKRLKAELAELQSEVEDLTPQEALDELAKQAQELGIE